MTQNYSLTAVFRKYNNLTVGILSTPPGGGWTAPAEGTGQYPCDSIICLRAFPWPGWNFTHWIIDGQNIYSCYWNISMSTSHTAIACFLFSDGGGSEGCPALFPWNGTNYVSYGVINIHNPTGQDVIREVSVQKQDVAVTNYLGNFTLFEGWYGLNFSESVIDQVKLYAVDNNGNRYLCPLVAANHSRLGTSCPNSSGATTGKANRFSLTPRI